MRRLTPIQRDHQELYTSCIEQTGNAAKRQRLADMTDRVVAAGEAYHAQLSAGRADNIVAMAMSCEERSDLSTLYDYRLVSQQGVERRTYDQIKMLATHCPYCGFGEVYQLDHYLSKDGFPELNVLPRNIVPICHPCNHIKTTTPPADQNTSFIHPYYDTLPDERWLFAELRIEAEGPVLDFRVALQPAHGTLSNRLSFHFVELRLPVRMRNHAATILSEMEADIDEYIEELGAQGIRDHFLDSGERAFRRHGNTLEAAAYFAAAENAEYCSGAFKN